MWSHLNQITRQLVGKRKDITKPNKQDEQLVSEMEFVSNSDLKLTMSASEMFEHVIIQVKIRQLRMSNGM
jgi:hypothetical protein